MSWLRGEDHYLPSSPLDYFEYFFRVSVGSRLDHYHILFKFIS